MTLKTKVAGFLTFAPGDDVQTYLWRWLGQSWRQTDALFDPLTGHNHNGSGSNGPIISGGGGASNPINWRGAWSAATAYVANDGVNYQGSSYVATAPVTGTAPPTAPWQLVAQQGATGATGPQGPTGATGATGAQGPAGATGPTGATGAQGAAGLSVTWRGPWSAATAYAVNDAVSSAGSSYICTAAVTGGSGPASDPTHWSLMAQQGATGATGAQGATGATGSQGPTGATGAAGVRGSLWYTGSGAPGTIAGAIAQDLYLDTATGNVYQFS